MRNKSYSHLIVPLTIIVHLIIINAILWIFTAEIYLNIWAFLYYNLSWLTISHQLKFYPTGRREAFMTNIRKLAYLFAIFGLAYMAWFVFAGIVITELYYYCAVYVLICFTITTYRYIFYIFVRHYRLSGRNYVKVLVIGRDKNLKKIRKIFDNPQYGYRYCGFFDDGPSISPTYHGPVVGCFKYILENKIDEVYCTAAKLSKDQLQNLINFADNNLIKLKIIPDNKEIFTRSMSVEQYGTIPVLKLRTTPLEAEVAIVAKRTFDIVFSTFAIIMLLSWLIPLLYVLIKLESPGPLFFKQKRHGLNRQAFWCFKFRSMANNTDSDSKMATKNDMRVTKIGRIIRKTSIDELPQFLNVFMGDMSVVGPRPHMEKHTADYEISVDKYLVRHFVKPGITGLAQVQGYRGEISLPSDILNRIRLDILYVEKWSLWLDLKIIYKTLANAIMGEEKAY